MRRPKPRAGSRWRLLAHDMVTSPRGHYGTARNVYGYDPAGDLRNFSAGLREDVEKQRRDFEDRGLTTTHVYPDTEFDELVVGGSKDVWLHIEQMDTGLWWMNVAGVTIHVQADSYGRPKRITIDGPGFYDDAREGCEYDLRGWPDDERTAP